MTYSATRKYGQKIDAAADAKLAKLLTFLEMEGHAFYELTGPVITEKSEGSNRYVHITISIKLA